MSARFEELSVGEEIPPSPRVFTRDDLKAYADASGDQNPIHRDDEVARAAGFPGVIAHGMLTMGHLVSCLVVWAGDPAALARMRVQFRAPVFLGETIVAGGTVKALDPEARTATLDVWVRLEREGVTEWAIRRGEAELRLP